MIPSWLKDLIGWHWGESADEVLLRKVFSPKELEFAKHTSLCPKWSFKLFEEGNEIWWMKVDNAGAINDLKPYISIIITDRFDINPETGIKTYKGCWFLFNDQWVNDNYDAIYNGLLELKTRYKKAFNGGFE